MGDLLSRRNLLTASSGLLIIKAETALGSQANSALSVGLIGCGRRGMFDAGIFAKQEHARITAICDIYDDQLAKAAESFPGAKRYKRYQELLESNVDVVLIATPPFLRPEQFEAASTTGKHIYMEKPLAVNPAGCRRVLAAAKKVDKTKRVTVGFQQRYGRDYRKAYSIIRSGQPGAIEMVRVSWMSGDLPFRRGHPASEEKIRNWVWYRDTSGDIVVEQDCHNFDVVNWFMGTHPVKAAGYGGRKVRTYGDNLDHLTVSFAFANGVHFSYSANQFSTRGFRDVGEVFICEKGALETSRQGYRWFNKVVDETPLDKGYRTPGPGEEPLEVHTNYDITEDAVRDFVDGVLAARIENTVFSAVESMYTAMMAREAIYTGKEIAWEDITRA